MTDTFELNPVFSSDPLNTVNTGSSARIGDGALLTAAHNLFKITNFEKDPSQRSVSDIERDTRYSTFLDVRDYRTALESAYLNYIVRQDSFGNDEPDVVSIGRVFAEVVGQDMFLINRSSGSAASSEAGMMVFLDPSDIEAPEFGLVTADSSDGVIVRRRGWRANGSSNSVNDSTITLARTGFFFHGENDSAAFAKLGESGSGVIAKFDNASLALGGREFLIGNLVFITNDVGTPTDPEGRARGTYFTLSDFNGVSDALELAEDNGSRLQTGDVTDKEPTNLIVGRDQADGLVISNPDGTETALPITGSFRADIILGRGGDDVLSDGDTAGDTVWADDQLYGGAGDDWLIVGGGHNLIHGGDFRDYGGGRIALDADGIDTADFSGSSGGVSITVGATGKDNRYKDILGGDAPGSDFASAIFVGTRGNPRAGEPGSSNTLVSIEKINGSEQADTLSITSFDDAWLQSVQDQLNGQPIFDLAGSPGENGTGAMDLVSGGRELLGEGVTIDLSNPDAQFLRGNDTGKQVNFKNVESAIGTTVTNPLNPDAPNDTLIAVERGYQKTGSVLFGAGGNDTLIGSNSSNLLFGGDGDDIIHLGYNDFAVGGAGADEFHVTTTLSDSQFLQSNSVFILDFDPNEDKLFVNGDLFNGYNKTISATPLVVERDVPNEDFDRQFLVEETGVSNYGLNLLRARATPLAEEDLDSGAQLYADGNYRDISVSNLELQNGEFGKLSFIDANIDFPDDPIPGPDEPVPTATLNAFLNVYTGQLWDDGNESFFSRETPSVETSGIGFSLFDGLYRAGSVLIGEGRNPDGSRTGEPAPFSRIASTGFAADEREFGIEEWTNNPNTTVQILISANNNAQAVQAQSNNAVRANVTIDTGISFSFDNLFDVTLPFSAEDIQFVAFDGLLSGTDLSNARATEFGNILSLNELGVVPDASVLTSVGAGIGIVQFGSDDDEIFVGNAGSDILVGNGGNDLITVTMNGTADVDLIVGGTGDDEYIIEGAQGQFDKLVVAERLDAAQSAGGADILRINANSTDITVVEGNSPNDLRILVPEARGDGYGIIDVVNQLGADSDDWIEEIHFADGVVWTRTQLIVAAVAPDPITALPLADVIVDEDNAVSFSLSDGFSDTYRRDFDFALTLADGNPAPDWLSVENGSVIGTPPEHFNGQLDLTVLGTIGNETVSTDVSLTITPVNDAPEVESPLTSVFLDEGEAVDIEVPQDTFIDVDGDALTLSASLSDASPLPAWLSFDGTRFTGTPPAGFTGVLSLAVTASDGSLDATDIFSIVVEDANSAPEVNLALADISSNEDTAIDILLTADTFTDIDGDALTLSATQSDQSPLPAWLVFDGERFSGTPPQDFNGVLELTVTASDGESTASDNFTLTIDPVNDAPVLALMVSDQMSLEDTAIDFAVPAGTFADVDGDTLTLSATLADGSDLPVWLSFDGARFTGQPPQDFNGLIEIELSASDGEFVATDQFALSIDPVNDPPVVLTPLADASSPEDSAFDILIPAGTFEDVDGDTLTLSATLSDGSDLPSWINFDGVNLSGTPPQDFNGDVSIAITASDGELDIIDHFVLTIDPVNDAPVVLNPIADVDSAEDVIVNIALPSNVFDDVDGDALTLSATLAAGGDLPAWLSFDGVRFTGEPPADFNGSLAIRVTASDGELEATNDFNLSIDPVNDAPVVLTTLPNVASDEDTAFDIALPSDTFGDVDGDPLTLSATLVSGQALPSWLSFDGTSFTGTPPQDFNGALEIEVTASDGSLEVSDSFVFTINPVNDAPVAVDDDIFLSEGGDELTILQSSLLENDGDVDGDALTVTSVTDGTNGTVGFDVDGNIVYTPNAGFEGEDSFTYTISDGELTSTATAQLRVDDPFSGWRQGTEGNDFLFGNFFHENEIFGRGGNDVITGGFRTDYLAGGGGNDILFGLFNDDHLWGNAGDDLLFGGFGTDTAYFDGNSADYELQTESGGFFVRIRDEEPGIDGDDGRDQLFSIERLAFANETISVSSPIILDLDGDGTEFVSAAQSNALFDLDSDGVKDDTAWIGSGDAFLFLDRDGDGFVSGANEISFVDDVEDARSDLDGLRSFDSNGDGILSADDDRFAEFGAWQDLDTDGAVDVGETLTLSEAGVVSINLNATATEAGFTLGDVAVINQGQFQRADGTTGAFADAAITFFQKGTPELPSIDFDTAYFARKKKKYRIHAVNGELMIGSKRSPKDNLDAASILNFRGKQFGMLSPIILDLDGDGVEMRHYKKSSARFDMDGDGSRDNVGWTGKGDGFLVVDRNGNGLIDNGAELSFLTENPDAKSDLQALTVFDSNGDGEVSALDVRFRELKVWVDANDNGQTDAGELRSLQDHGIASINLSGQATSDRAKIGGNILLATSTFTRVDGSTGQVGDTALAFRPTPGLSPQFSNQPTRIVRQDQFENSDDFGPRAPVGERYRQRGMSDSSFNAMRATLNDGNPFGSAVSSQSGGGQTSQMVSKEPVSNDIAFDPDALKLALMAQDMASFGAERAGALSLKDRREPANISLFAA